MCATSVFFLSLLFLQLWWPIEPKFPQICYLMHMLGYQVRMPKNDHYLVSTVLFASMGTNMGMVCAFVRCSCVMAQGLICFHQCRNIWPFLFTFSVIFSLNHVSPTTPMILFWKALCNNNMRFEYFWPNGSFKMARQLKWSETLVELGAIRMMVKLVEKWYCFCVHAKFALFIAFSIFKLPSYVISHVLIYWAHGGRKKGLMFPPMPWAKRALRDHPKLCFPCVLHLPIEMTFPMTLRSNKRETPEKCDTTTACKNNGWSMSGWYGMW